MLPQKQSKKPLHSFDGGVCFHNQTKTKPKPKWSHELHGQPSSSDIVVMKTYNFSGDTKSNPRQTISPGHCKEEKFATAPPVKHHKCTGVQFM